MVGAHAGAALTLDDAGCRGVSPCTLQHVHSVQPTQPQPLAAAGTVGSTPAAANAQACLSTAISDIAWLALWQHAPRTTNTTTTNMLLLLLLLLSVCQAGFSTPAAELDYKVSAATAGAESLKDMLARIKPYTTPGEGGGLRGQGLYKRVVEVQ